MKRTDLAKALRKLGWKLKRQGKKHEVWVCESCGATMAVPRHKEINELTARAILETAKKCCEGVAK